ncbi:uncharacterized protein LOC103788657 isoform X1 [Callithrix jacchus]
MVMCPRSRTPRAGSGDVRSSSARLQGSHSRTQKPPPCPIPHRSPSTSATRCGSSTVRSPRKAPGESPPITSRRTCSLGTPLDSAGWAAPALAGGVGRGGALPEHPGSCRPGAVPVSLLSLSPPTPSGFYSSCR